MSDLVNLVAVTRALAGSGGPTLEVVRLDANDTTVIPFTCDAKRIDLHYCSDPELGSTYVPCNQESEGRCLLCDIGRTREPRYLLPVYRPMERDVGVLPVSPSQRPNALLPQILSILERKESIVLFVRREASKFCVDSAPLKAGCDDGAMAIAAFRERLERKDVRLEDAYSRVPNARLATVPAIAQALAFRGKSA
jgi:hypothetical protein